MQWTVRWWAGTCSMHANLAQVFLMQCLRAARREQQMPCAFGSPPAVPATTWRLVLESALPLRLPHRIRDGRDHLPRPTCRHPPPEPRRRVARSVARSDDDDDDDDGASVGATRHLDVASAPSRRLSRRHPASRRCLGAISAPSRRLSRRHPASRRCLSSRQRRTSRPCRRP